ncbi:MAG TPA: DUF1345 domain-containing protein [Xanthobacteraceae bacterium]|nr:DUF1345 domain-containing protein [Xanthobacteraceae bacterium]
MTRAIGAIRARPWLFGAIALGAGIALLLPESLDLITRMLAGWCGGAAAFVLLVCTTMSARSQKSLQTLAEALDDGAVPILILALFATAASFIAVAFELQGLERVAPEHRAFHIGLAGATIILSWFFVQTVFSVHYAHVYYGDDEAGADRGGLDFGGDAPPDFWDFVYFTITIGATSQTSDTNVTSSLMRRIVTAHAVFSFFFNTTVLALAINIAATLVSP